MARKTSRAEQISALAHPEDRRDAARRARAEVRFDEQAMLGALFGEFDANLVQIENRLGVLISARGNKVSIEGQEDEVARAREVLVAMHEKLLTGQELDSGTIEALIALSNEPTLEGIISADHIYGTDRSRRSGLPSRAHKSLRSVLLRRSRRARARVS